MLVFVEDEERAAALKSLLGSVQGITLELAYTVSHIHRYCNAAPVDVILLDLPQAGDESSTNLIRDLNQPGLETSLIPLTALVPADADIDFRLAALAAGAAELFVEPIDEINLLTRLVLLGRIRQAEDAIRRLAITDPLTGLFDERYFLLRMGEELARARRYARPLTCCICSLDNLPEADGLDSAEARQRRMLQLAVILQAEKRDIDVLSRCGVSDFGMLLYNTDIPGAVVLAERIRRQLAQLEPDSFGGMGELSTGIASVRPQDEQRLHPEEFRQRALLALEQARRQGGGCNVIFSPEVATQQFAG